MLLPRAAYPQVGWCGFVQEGFILLKYHTQYCPRVFDKMRVVPGTVARGTLFPPSLLIFVKMIYFDCVLMTALQIVYNDNFFILGLKIFNGVGPNVARSAGNKY